MEAAADDIALSRLTEKSRLCYHLNQIPSESRILEGFMDLSTTYMGMELRNPVIIGSCGFTSSVDSIRRLEDRGAGAVVLKSIFEEQILNEAGELHQGSPGHSEAADLITQYTRRHSLSEYLRLIRESREKTDIPIIASINCISASEWTDYARQIEQAGAHALELNLFVLPADTRQDGEDVEKIYFDIVNQVTAQVIIPVALKISPYFSGLANAAFNLSLRNIAALVLFNRFYNPDIDISEMKVIKGEITSTPSENAMVLRWIALLAGRVRCDLAATTGIHDGAAVIKNLLAGAAAVQIASAVYKQGPEVITSMLADIRQWMEKTGLERLRDAIGRLSHKRIDSPQLYERAQFMKYFAGAED
ncbi:MAG: dihydroorotate dehydrogenase-like protein [Acidobacteriota bacterium]|jgi:dihydroorotate dehydrogenase (fumarate)|nr:dihydroorotate dehydrogenase-like protein [Acidobacteriota bacterium]